MSSVTFLIVECKTFKSCLLILFSIKNSPCKPGIPEFTYDDHIRMISKKKWSGNTSLPSRSLKNADASKTLASYGATSKIFDGENSNTKAIDSQFSNYFFLNLNSENQ